MALGNGNIQSFNTTDVDYNSTLDKLITAGTAIYTTKLQTDAQIKALKNANSSTQIAALKQSPLYNPTPVVQAPQTYSGAATAFVQKNNNTVLLIGLAAGALALILIMRK